MGIWGPKGWGKLSSVVVGIGLVALLAAGCNRLDLVSAASPTTSVTAADVAAPGVTGMKGDKARDTLEAQGFTVEWGNETVIVASNWTVDVQAPVAGALAQRGSTVTLTVSKPKPSSSPTQTPTSAPAAPSEPAAPAPVAPAPPAPEPVAPEPAPPAAPEPQPEQHAPAPPAAAYYPNCAAARAAGVAPIHRGEPGYSSKLDRDGDGIACE